MKGAFRFEWGVWGYLWVKREKIERRGGCELVGKRGNEEEVLD